MKDSSLIHKPALAIICAVVVAVISLNSVGTVLLADTTPQPEQIRELSDASAVAGVATDIDQEVYDLLAEIKNSILPDFSEVLQKNTTSGEQVWQVSGTGTAQTVASIDEYFTSRGFKKVPTQAAATVYVRDSILCSVAQSTSNVVVLCRLR